MPDKFYTFCHYVAVANMLACSILFVSLPFLGALANEVPAIYTDLYVAGLGSTFLASIVFGVISMGDA